MTQAQPGTQADRLTAGAAVCSVSVFLRYFNVTPLTDGAPSIPVQYLYIRTLFREIHEMQFYHIFVRKIRLYDYSHSVPRYVSAQAADCNTWNM